MKAEYSLNGNEGNGFFGIGETIEASLLDYGMVMRNTRGDEYEVYFKVMEGYYGWGTIYKSEIEDIINGKSWVPEEKVEKMLKTSGQTKETFLDMPIELQIFTIRTVLGHSNTFGKTIEVYSTEEVMNAMLPVEDVEEEIDSETEIEF